MNWNLLRERFGNAVFPGEKIGLLHTVKEEVWPPRTSVEIRQQLEPVNDTVRFLLEVTSQARAYDKVYATALTFALEISFPQHGESYCRVELTTLDEILTELVAAGKMDAYQGPLHREHYPAKISTFLEKYAKWHTSWRFQHPQKPDPIDVKWIEACVASGKTTLLTDYVGSARIVANFLKARLVNSRVDSNTKLKEALKLRERQEQVDFRRRWAEAYVLQSARAGLLDSL